MDDTAIERRSGFGVEGNIEALVVCALVEVEDLLAVDQRRRQQDLHAHWGRKAHEASAYVVWAGVSKQAGWSHHSLLELVTGLALTADGATVISWALAVNPHFEPTVRIQHDRTHRVCTTGPYRWVRDPSWLLDSFGPRSLSLTRPAQDH